MVVTSGDKLVPSVRYELDRTADLYCQSILNFKAMGDKRAHIVVLCIKFLDLLLPQLDQSNDPRIQTECKVALVSIQSKLTEARAR